LLGDDGGCAAEDGNQQDGVTHGYFGWCSPNIGWSCGLHGVFLMNGGG
jgi:hypothetical protein